MQFLGNRNSKPLILFFIISILGILFYVNGNLQSRIQTQIEKNPFTKVENGTTSPTPFPYQEMTIPYLREQTFISSLGERTLAYERTNYSAFLTSYTSDNLKVNGLLTIPKGAMPQQGWPAVIFIHGYIPPRQYNTQTQYIDYVDYLARNGLAVFKIDLRGHGQSEGEPGGGYYGADYVRDTLNAYTALQSSPEINKNGIGLWGHSMAGNIVLRSVAAKKNIPAVVIWAGAVYTYLDWREYGIQDSSYVPPAPSTTGSNRRQRIIDAVGEISANNPFWQQVAATNYLSDVSTDIEIHHAVDDPVVKIAYSRNLETILTENKVPHQLYEYQSGGHNITGVSFTQAMQRTVEFFKTSLK